MKILITGACGLVGSAIRRLGAQEHTFVNVDLNEEVKAIGGTCASFADRDVIRRAAEGCDAIIHTAAMHGSGYKKVPNEEYIRVNVIGTEYLFAAAVEHGIRRVVCSSSLEVLCGIDWKASGARRYDQHTPPRPDWIYPTTKLMVEELGAMYHREHGLEVAQLRYSWVREVPARKIGYGLLARSVAVDDVAEVNLLCTTRPNIKNDMFLVTSGSPLDDDDIIAAHQDPWAPLERHWPGSRPVVEPIYGTPRWEECWPTACLEPVRRALGWEPKITFDNLLRDLGYTPERACAGDRTATR